MSMIGTVLGSDDAEALQEAAPCGSTGPAEALAMEMALRDDAGDRPHSEVVSRFLVEQTRYIRMQASGYAEDQTLRLRHLRSQARESQLRRIGQAIRIAIQMFTALILSVAAFGLGVMVYQAVTSRSVIVEPFDAPANLAGSGLTGRVVASGLLDDLTRLQTSTRVDLKKRALSNAWANTIKIAMPQTGISLEEIDQLIRSRFGHDLHIYGDLIKTPDGNLALTVRGEGLMPSTFRGRPEEYDTLLMHAAEFVYGQSEPALYAGYLVNGGRNAEAITFCKTAYAHASAADRPHVLNAWANAIENTGGSLEGAQRLYEEALRLQPEYWVAYTNLMNVDLMRADEEGVWRIGQQLLKAAHGRPGLASDFAYQNLDTVTWNLGAIRMAIQEDAEKHDGVGSSTIAEQPVLAGIDVDLHDAQRARLLLQLSGDDARDPTVAAMGHFVRGRLALEEGDGRTAGTEMERFGDAFANPAVSSNLSGFNCWIAPAEEAAGHPDRADALLNKAGHFVDCFRFRADLLDHRGNWAGAQRAYQAAVDLAPHLPAAYFSWAQALARHGDLKGALVKLAEASARGPNWADPIKARGDILERQGRWPEALAAYNQAALDAPAWVALKQAQAVAGAHAGT